MNKHNIEICAPNCAERSIHCHSTCKRYAEKLAEMNKIRDARYKEYMKNAGIHQVYKNGVAHNNTIKSNNRKARYETVKVKRIKKAPTEAATSEEAAEDI